MTETQKLPTKLTESLIIPMDKKSNYIVAVSADNITLEDFQSGVSQLLNSRPDLIEPFKNPGNAPHNLLDSAKELAIWGRPRGLEVEIRRKSSNIFSSTVSRLIYFVTGKMV